MAEKWTRPDPTPNWFDEQDRQALHRQSRNVFKRALDWRNMAPTPTARRLLRGDYIRQRKASADLGHILNAVDPGYREKNRPIIPVHLNHRRLRRDLDDAFVLYLTKSDMDAVGVAVTRSERLRKAAVNARELVTLLGDDWLGWRLSRTMQPGAFSMAQASIRRLMRAAEHEVATGLFDGRPFERQRMSPIRWLLGVELPRIFERWFGRRAGTSTNPYDGKLDGPFIRFAVAAMDDYRRRDPRYPLEAAGTVKKYLNDARKGITGRKIVKQGMKAPLP